jgi:hypothetical protein
MSGKILVEDTAKASDSADISWTKAPRERWSNIRQGEGSCFNFPRGAPREGCHFCQRHSASLCLAGQSGLRQATNHHTIRGFVLDFQDGVIRIRVRPARQRVFCNQLLHWLVALWAALAVLARYLFWAIVCETLVSPFEETPRALCSLVSYTAARN